MKYRCFFAAFFCLALSPVHAFDQEKFAEHVMKLFNLDTRDGVTVSKPVPSQFKEFLVATATIRNNPYPFYLTPDKKFFFWGEPLDAVTDPDALRWAHVNLTGVHAKGSEKAPVTVVEFSSFQCSHCKHAHQALSEELYKAFSTNQVRWVAKNFPLESNDWAESAAVAAECAGRQSEEAYWKMAELIFSTDTISPQNVKDMTSGFANKLNLNMPQFNECFDGKRTLEKVKADKVEGTKAGVSSTPTFFVNGRMRRGFRNFEDFKVLIDEKLKIAK